MSDAIAAVSTGRQVCAIGIIRLSGDGCIEIAQQVFTALRHPLTQAPSRKLVMGTLHDAQGRVIDQCMAVCCRQPHRPRLPTMSAGPGTSRSTAIALSL